jgi:chemotaxis protein CheD
MGQIGAGVAPCVFHAVLGSCVGLAIYDPQACVGAFAHILLPRSEGRAGPPGKFADTALPQMLELVESLGGSRSRLIARLCGGARMFATQGPLQVGEVNHRTAAEIVAKAGIPILGRHVGGNAGRRASFDLATGIVTVEVSGEPPLEI